VVLRNQREGFGPLEGGAFARVEERRFAPGVESAEALLRIAGGARIYSVHVDTVGAAVNLRSAKFYQVEKFFFDGGGFEMFFQREHGVQGVWRIGDAWSHG
jgi:hypothetical protein